MTDKKYYTVSELEEIIKEMARQHPGQKDKHIPQVQANIAKPKVVVAKAVPQKRIRKGTQKGG